MSLRRQPGLTRLIPVEFFQFCLNIFTCYFSSFQDQMPLPEVSQTAIVLDSRLYVNSLSRPNELSMKEDAIIFSLCISNMGKHNSLFEVVFFFLFWDKFCRFIFKKWCKTGKISKSSSVNNRKHYRCSITQLFDSLIKVVSIWPLKRATTGNYIKNKEFK